MFFSILSPALDLIDRICFITPPRSRGLFPSIPIPLGLALEFAGGLLRKAKLCASTVAGFIKPSKFVSTSNYVNFFKESINFLNGIYNLSCLDCPAIYLIGKLRAVSMLGLMSINCL